MTTHHLVNVPVSASLWSRRKEEIAIALLGSIPLGLGSKLRRIGYRKLFAKLGTAVNILPDAEFLRAVLIEIGDKVKIARNVRLACRDESSRIAVAEDVVLDRGVDITAHRGAHIAIGKATYIGAYVCMSGPGHVQIGKNCLIAAQCGIYANNHNFDSLALPIREQGVTCEGIVIEDDCWLGCGVRVLDGVTIGRGSVIGAGAVVTRNIPPYSVAVGVPARVISSRAPLPHSTAQPELN